MTPEEHFEFIERYRRIIRAIRRRIRAFRRHSAKVRREYAAQAAIADRRLSQLLRTVELDHQSIKALERKATSSGSQLS